MINLQLSTSSKVERNKYNTARKQVRLVASANHFFSNEATQGKILRYAEQGELSNMLGTRSL